MTGNVADDKGGALFASSFATVLLQKLIVERNLIGQHAESVGGAFFIGDGAHVTLKQSSLSHHSANKRGGAGYISAGTLRLSQTNVTENHAVGAFGLPCTKGYEHPGIVKNTQY